LLFVEPTVEEQQKLPFYPQQLGYLLEFVYRHRWVLRLVLREH
jgi:hypothetical protein